MAIGQAAVHHGHALGPYHRLQPRAQGLFQLRRQIDFRHHKKHLPPLLQHRHGRVQVDLGFTAAGNPMQQHGFMAFNGCNTIHSLLLRGVQGECKRRR